MSEQTPQQIVAVDSRYSLLLYSNLGHYLLASACQHPNKACVETAAGCWTYAEVARMTESIRVVLQRALGRCETSAGEGEAAQTLQPPFHGRRPDEHVICVVLDRGVESFAAVHAVMLAGCAYTCFDATEPREKLATWMEVVKPPVMISAPHIMARVGLSEKGWSLGRFPEFVLDVLEVIRKGEGKVEAQAPVWQDSDLDRLCYTIFTSGSTGKPKAVMVQHRSAVNVVRVWSDFVGMQHSDRVAQNLSMAFDAHVIEVFGALYRGCTSIIVPDMVKRSGPDLLRWLQDRQICVVSMVPTLLRSMSSGGVDVSREALSHLRMIDVGGEALGQDVVSSWAPGREFFNTYGPTETTVVSAGIRVEPGHVITIGWDLPTYTSYIMDPETLEQVPHGARGVLFTGGVGLARGYLDDEKKTAAKFVHVGGLGRLYNTGDMVSRDEANRLVYHGRVDWQVKVRGQRIELETLESTIANVPGVKHCEARAVEGGQKLALIASGSGLDAVMLKEAAAKLGKAYQVNIVKICEDSAWKVNTSGKIVRNHVQFDGDAAGAEDARGDAMDWFDGAETSVMEQQIAACIAQLLPPKHWTKASHFIDDLAIDSAGIARLIGIVRRNPALASVDLAMIYENPTVASLAECLFRKQQDSRAESDDESLSGQGVEDLLDLFLAAVESRSHSLCCEGAAASMTYAQVYRVAAATQVLLHKALRAQPAREHLHGQERRDQQRPVVALLLRRGADRLVGAVAALLEGMAFCALDADASREELAEQLMLLRPAAILTEDPTAPLLVDLDCEAGHCAIVDVAKALQAKLVDKPQRARRRRQQSLLCCITFAAESKDDARILVEITHSAALRVVQQCCESLGLAPVDRVVQLLPLCFSLPGFPALALAPWGAIACGATLLFPSSLDSRLSLSWLRRCRATVLSGRPSLLRSATAGCVALPELRLLWVTSGGDASALAAKWMAPGRRLLQLHGREKGSLEFVIAELQTPPCRSEGVLPRLLGNRHNADQPMLKEMKSSASKLGKLPREGTTKSFFGYILDIGGGDGEDEDSNGEKPWPALCFVVQSIAIVVDPVLEAAKTAITAQLLLPLALDIEVSFLVIASVMVGLMLLEGMVRFGALLVLKWTLIGRYCQGSHPIYGTYFLRHWLVDFAASKTFVMKGSGWAFGIGDNLLRNLGLRMLGADVAWSAMITARIAGFDLIKVGPLACVHGHKRLAAVSFEGKRMHAGPIEIGAGAHVGQDSIVAAGARILPGAFVEPCSSVEPGSVVSGCWTGVPGRQVEASAGSDRVVTQQAARRFVVLSALFLGTTTLLNQSKAVLPLAALFFIRLKLHVGNPGLINSWVTAHLPWLIALILFLAFFKIAGGLIFGALVNRLMPKVPLPMDAPLYSPWAWLAAFKLKLVSSASATLGDASLQPQFLRLCGAKIGPNSAVCESVILPEHVEAGAGSFFASGNVLTSMVVDQGRMKIPHKTVLGDRCFLGNENHVAEGLPAGSFCGLGTYVRQTPLEAMALFGNPPMKFVRPGNQLNLVEEVTPSHCMMAWFHFSTSFIDPFVWHVMKGLEISVAFASSQLIFPSIDSKAAWTAVILIYFLVNLATWYLLAVLFAGALYNDRLPQSSAHHSLVVTCWNNAVNIRKVFKCPFNTAGTMWHSSVLRLFGAHIGKGFFSPEDISMIMIDPPFCRLGDDVTIDWDGQIRNHSFEDHCLKYSIHHVADRTTLLQASMLSMSDTKEGATLGRKSVTWKGQVLEAGQRYIGAPAMAVVADTDAMV